MSHDRQRGDALAQIIGGADVYADNGELPDGFVDHVNNTLKEYDLEHLLIE